MNGEIPDVTISFCRDIVCDDDSIEPHTFKVKDVINTCFTDIPTDISTEQIDLDSIHLIDVNSVGSPIRTFQDANKNFYENNLCLDFIPKPEHICYMCKLEITVNINGDTFSGETITCESDKRCQQHHNCRKG